MAKSTFGWIGARRWAAGHDVVGHRHRPAAARRLAGAARAAHGPGIAVDVQLVAEAREAAVHPQRLGGGDQRAARQHRGVEHAARRRLARPCSRPSSARARRRSRRTGRPAPTPRSAPRTSRRPARGRRSRTSAALSSAEQLGPGSHRRQAGPEPPGDGRPQRHAVAQDAAEASGRRPPTGRLSTTRGDQRPPAGGDGLGPEVAPRADRRRRPGRRRASVSRSPRLPPGRRPPAAPPAQGRGSATRGAPVHSSSATCSKVVDVARPTASWPRKRSASAVDLGEVGLDLHLERQRRLARRGRPRRPSPPRRGVEQARPAVAAGCSEHAGSRRRTRSRPSRRAARCLVRRQGR